MPVIPACRESILKKDSEQTGMTKEERTCVRTYGVISKYEFWIVDSKFKIKNSRLQ